MQHVIEKTNAVEFCGKFEDTIRDDKNSSGAVPLSEEEKRDAFYNAVRVSVPNVQTIDFVSKRTKGNRLSYDELKIIVMQDEAERNQASRTSVYTPGGQNQARSSNYMEMAKVRCYECQGQGHYGRDCFNKGKGIKSYNCNGYGTHRASECPYPPRQGQSEQGGESRENPRYINSHNARGFGKNGRGRVYKRKSEQNSSNNAKRGRY